MLGLFFPSCVRLPWYSVSCLFFLNVAFVAAVRAHLVLIKFYVAPEAMSACVAPVRVCYEVRIFHFLPCNRLSLLHSLLYYIVLLLVAVEAHIPISYFVSSKLC